MKVYCPDRHVGKKWLDLPTFGKMVKVSISTFFFLFISAKPIILKCSKYRTGAQLVEQKCICPKQNEIAEKICSWLKGYLSRKRWWDLFSLNHSVKQVGLLLARIEFNWLAVHWPRLPSRTLHNLRALTLLNYIQVPVQQFFVKCLVRICSFLSVFGTRKRKLCMIAQKVEHYGTTNAMCGQKKKKTGHKYLLIDSRKKIPPTPLWLLHARLLDPQKAGSKRETPIILFSGVCLAWHAGFISWNYKTSEKNFASTQEIPAAPMQNLPETIYG